MYGIALNTTELLMQLGQIPDTATLCLEDACPYMTQKMTIHFAPEDAQIPVLSWQLAHQLEPHLQNHPSLRFFRLVPISQEQGWPVPLKLKTFDGVPPGRVLFLMANLKRGLGDMLLLMPILRAQAKSLEERGWPSQISISSANKFKPLFYRQPFVDSLFPECPLLSDVINYDYVIEYGLHIHRMKHLVGVQDWREIDLRVELHVPDEVIERWHSEFPGDRIKIFFNWISSDKKRSLSLDYFQAVKAAFPDARYYTSQVKNFKYGELFPGGPFNLFPKEKSLLDLFGILSQMDIVITANTGIAHIAAALGKPTIVLFTGRLYGWEGYWPDLHRELYPTMYPIGLEEDLQLDPETLPTKIRHQVETILAAA